MRDLFGLSAAEPAFAASKETSLTAGYQSQERLRASSVGRPLVTILNPTRIQTRKERERKRKSSALWM